MRRRWLNFGAVAHYLDQANPRKLAERTTGSGEWTPARDAGVVALCEECRAHVRAGKQA